MDKAIISHADILKLFKAAPERMTDAEKVAHVAGLTGLDPIVIEGVIWKRESAHTQVMECVQ